MDVKIAIVGTGAVGESLSTVLHAAGYNVDCIISRTVQHALDLAHEVDASHALTFEDPLPAGIGLFFLCIPDDAVAVTADRMAKKDYDWSHVKVAHTSGALTSRALHSLTAKGACAFSFHPVQTFKKGIISNWDGVFVGIEGDAEGFHAGKQIVESLAGIPLALSLEDKVLYHASAVFASNFVVTAVGIAAEILGEINMSREEAIKLLQPLVQRTCDNIFASSPEKALTGPASRGDIQTIKKHAVALEERFPEKYALYLALTREAIKLKVRDDPAFADVARTMQGELDGLLQGSE